MTGCGLRFEFLDPMQDFLLNTLCQNAGADHITRQSPSGQVFFGGLHDVRNDSFRHPEHRSQKQ